LTVGLLKCFKILFPGFSCSLAIMSVWWGREGGQAKTMNLAGEPSARILKMELPVAALEFRVRALLR
jgi:hypothetical protein